MNVISSVMLKHWSISLETRKAKRPTYLLWRRVRFHIRLLARSDQLCGLAHLSFCLNLKLKFVVFCRQCFDRTLWSTRTVFTCGQSWKRSQKRLGSTSASTHAPTTRIVCSESGRDVTWSIVLLLSQCDVMQPVNRSKGFRWHLMILYLFSVRGLLWSL